MISFDKAFKISQYADDTYLYVQSENKMSQSVDCGDLARSWYGRGECHERGERGGGGGG